MYSCTCLVILGLFYLTHIVELRSTTTNYPVATTIAPESSTSSKTRYEQGLEDYDEEQARLRKDRRGRGMMTEYDDEFENYIYHDHEHDHDHDHEPPKKEEMKSEEKAVKADPWQGYYDFIINEGSFKFWAAFQLATAALLIYSACAAVYYAKFNPIAPDYDYYDDFFGRSDSGTPASSSPWAGLGVETFQRIFNALSSKKYS